MAKSAVGPISRILWPLHKPTHLPAAPKGRSSLRVDCVPLKRDVLKPHPPRISECNFIWKQSHCPFHGLKMRSLGGSYDTGTEAHREKTALRAWREK